MQDPIRNVTETVTAISKPKHAKERTRHPDYAFINANNLTAWFVAVIVVLIAIVTIFQYTIPSV
jgi:hypothetical protein